MINIKISTECYKYERETLFNEKNKRYGYD